MVEFLKKYSLLLIILLAGAIMRLYGFSEFSMTNDELSALLRTGYGSFGELIQKGVIETDPHPAGIQVFLHYWTGWFGDDAFVVRLPFVLMSIFTVWISYLLTNKWFGSRAALMVAAAMAILEFPINFGQLARPYSAGLFFGLTLSWFWTRLLFDEGKKLPVALGYVFLSVLSCYAHYFMALFAAVVGITGLVFLNRNNVKVYLLSNAAVVLLFLPHLSITMQHMKVGGLSGWLPPPKPDFFLSHLIFLFNNSVFLLLFTLLLAVSLGWIFRKQIRRSRFRFIALTWFLFPLLLGYWYSVNYHTVLMDRVLLFTFPFFLMFMFSFIQGSGYDYRVSIGVVLMLGIGAYNTIVTNQFYTSRPFEDFSLLTQKIREWNEKYGPEDITRTINVNSPFYLDYYFSRMNYKTNFERYMTMRKEHIKPFKTLVEQSNTPYFMAGWACIHNPYEIPELIKRKYPVEVERVKSFNTELILYGKDPEAHRERVLHNLMGFEEKDSIWTMDEQFLDSSVSHTGNWSYYMNDAVEFGPTIKIGSGSMLEKGVNVLNISVRCRANGPLTALLVMSVEREGAEKSLAWYSTNTGDFIEENHGWQEVFMARKLPKDLKATDKIVIYLWNKDKNDFHIDDMEISSFADSYYQYYDE